jgi:uncharacterized integral membrane protein
MKTISNILVSIIISIWIGLIAIFSVQNIQPVTLNFLWYESIQLTTGLVLSFSVGIGFLLGGIISGFASKNKKRNIPKKKPSKTKFSRVRREEVANTNKKQNTGEDWTQKPSEDW